MAKILIIDDQETVCFTLSKILEKRGHLVHTVQSVGKGIEVLLKPARGDHPYELLIIDLRFENLDRPEHEKTRAGMSVIAEALKLPFLEIIVLTGHPTPQTASESIAKGVFRYIIKEKKGYLEELVESVELAMESRKNLVSLDGCLKELHRLLGSLKDSNVNNQLIEEASAYLELAQKAYNVLLRARGKHP